MEKDKYYTPEPEEFCKGFELELLNLSLPDDEKQPTKWVKRTFGNNYLQMIEYTKDQLSNFCRVKYLDIEDVESFGLSVWNDTDINIYFNNQYKTIIYRGSEINLSCVYNKRSNWLCVAIEDKWIEKSTSNTLFAGYIKNKSEFSRLLKQLSII